jgi:hypothetical protein
MSETRESATEAAEDLEKMTVSTDAQSQNPPSVDSALSSSTKSALEENIERKGKHAYYFAHAHKADGPEWDGKAEPKLLSSASLPADESDTVKKSSFEYHKSNITAYAFSDEGKSVKLYVTMEGVGEKCSDEDISLDFTENSLCLVVRNYKDEHQCLSFGKLKASITNATYRKKKDRIIVSLKKEKEGEWHTINDKGALDHELV